MKSTIYIKKTKDFIKDFNMGECLEGQEKNIAAIQLEKDFNCIVDDENFCWSIYIKFYNENFYRDYATNEISNSRIKELVKKYC